MLLRAKYTTKYSLTSIFFFVLFSLFFSLSLVFIYRGTSFIFLLDLNWIIWLFSGLWFNQNWIFPSQLSVWFGMVWFTPVLYFLASTIYKSRQTKHSNHIRYYAGMVGEHNSHTGWWAYVKYNKKTSCFYIHGYV